jgi:PhnB protein
MKTVPYFYFNGNASQSLDFYTGVFDAKPSQVMLYKDMPGGDQTSPFANKVLHAEIMFGEDIYYISDAVGDREVTVGTNVQINLNCDSEEELRKIFSRLSAEARSTMPIEHTFWGAVFAGVTDQFGVSWTLNYQKPEGM